MTRANDIASLVNAIGIGVTGAVTADGLTVDTNTLHVDATNNRVGVGTVSPNKELSVVGNVELYNDEVDGYIWFHDYGTASYAIGRDQSSDTFSINRYSDLTTNPLVTVTSGGQLMVNCTADQVTSYEKMSVNGSGGFKSASTSVLALWQTNTSGIAAQFFSGGSGFNCGSIAVDNVGTTYNTTSDIRLKTDIAPIADATDKLMAMNAVTHKWKADPDADAVVGFIAQEMADIVPEAVSKGGSEDDMWSMDYGRITPVLVAALQDAVNEIKTLKERVAELEAK